MENQPVDTILPGKLINLDKYTIVTRPLYYSPQTRWSIDDKRINKIHTILPKTAFTIIATFPHGVKEDNVNIGCIVLVPESGLWWMRL